MSRAKGTRKMVSTGALTSRKLAQVDMAAECVYWRVYFAADKYGTMPGEAWDVLLQALPSKRGATEQSVDAALEALVDAGLVERWCESDRSTWIHVLGHDLHQQKSWLGRRGPRLTPLPPSQRSSGGEYVAIQDPLDAELLHVHASASKGSEPASERHPDPAQASTTPTPIRRRENGIDFSTANLAERQEFERQQRELEASEFYSYADQRIAPAPWTGDGAGTAAARLHTPLGQPTADHTCPQTEPHDDASLSEAPELATGSARTPLANFPVEANGEQLHDSRRDLLAAAHPASRASNHPATPQAAAQAMNGDHDTVVSQSA